MRNIGQVYTEHMATSNKIYWKDVAEFPNYQINGKGVIRGKAAKNIKKIGIHNGYPVVWFYKDGRRYRRRVHRIVAIAFVPNHKNPLIFGLVHHIDGDKMNYEMSNLEWVSAKEHNRGHRDKQIDDQTVVNQG